MAERRSRRRDRRRALQVAALGLATLVGVLWAFGGHPDLRNRLSALVFDFYQNVKPRQQAGAPIAIVDFDEASLREIGQWPWPRSDIARIVDNVRDLGAAAIAFDMVFSEPDRTSLGEAARALSRAGAKVELPNGLPDNDTLLAQSFARDGVTAGFVLSNETKTLPPPPKAGLAVAGASPDEYLLPFSGAVANLPALDDAAAGLGFYSFPPSPDGIVRSVPLVAMSGGQVYPALAVEALRTAQGASSIIIRATGASGEADTGRPAMTALKIGAFEVPTGASGEFLVYFSGLPNLPYIPAARLLDEKTAAQYADVLNGSIVLVGTSAVGLRDLVATPRASATPGVAVHAEIIDQILSGVFLTRPDWAPGAEISAAALLTMLLLVAVLSLGPLLGAVAAALITAIALAISWSAFLYGHLLIDPLLPSLSVVVVYLVVTAFLLLLTDRERQFVRHAFAHYLSPSLVERLAENPDALSLGGETREITILFSDIRGFTSLSEKLDPQQITGVLNRFLTPMTDVLLKSEATIDKYIGDAIMAFWNAPLSIERHPRSACLAALSMFTALDELNRREALGIKIGVGLNTGTCCVGNLGSQQRFSYSAIGDPVNVAARIEGLTKQYKLGILISEMTAAAAGDLAMIEVDRVRVVGRSEPVAIYTLLGDEAHAGEPAFKTHAEAHDRMLGAYRGRDFSTALTANREARRRGPEHLKGFYDLYAERIASLQETPPPANWDGVFNVLEK